MGFAAFDRVFSYLRPQDRRFLPSQCDRDYEANGQFHWMNDDYIKDIFTHLQRVASYWIGYDRGGYSSWKALMELTNGTWMWFTFSGEQGCCCGDRAKCTFVLCNDVATLIRRGIVGARERRKMQLHALLQCQSPESEPAYEATLRSIRYELEPEECRQQRQSRDDSVKMRERMRKDLRDRRARTRARSMDGRAKPCRESKNSLLRRAV